MLKETIISIYLFIFRIIFNLCKWLPLRHKTTFVTSFGDNIAHVAEASAQLTDHELIILKKSSCRLTFDHITGQQTIQFETFNLIDWIRSIYHLATSKVIFIDNYFGFLSVTDFKEPAICIQLWHAAGAIKQFGLLDPSIKDRSERANKRFKSVYQRFDYLTVGSEKMSAIYRKSFGVSNQQMINAGVPRTDFFFNEKEMSEVKRKLTNELKLIKDKKVILYAPTFRDDEINNPSIPLDIKKLHDRFKDTHVLLLRLHPAVRPEAFDTHAYSDFVVDVSHYSNINHLLVVTDLLISDYSSIPFEFALLEKPMIFYSYDLEAYKKERGFWEDYQTQMPGPIVFNTDEIIEVITKDNFDIKQIRNFSLQWNQYSRGNSSSSIVQYVHGFEQEQEQYEMLP